MSAPHLNFHLHPMKALLIDDEALARRELRTLLTAHPEIEIAGEAGNVTEALAQLKDSAIDVIFLDIQMPERSGFDLLEALPAPHPQIIFVTAFDAFAIRAFDVNAMDYLMKPVHPARLAAAVQKLTAPRPPQAAQSEIPLTEDDRVFIREGDRCWFLPIKKIWMLESEGNHTLIHFGSEKAMLHRSLNAMETRLPQSLFLRANRSQIINLHSIATIHPWFSGSLKVHLTTGEEIELSRRQSLLLRERTAL
jgi:two-component system LytT family response regulator